MVFMTVKRPNFSDLCLSQNLDRNSMTMAQEEKLTRKWEIFQGRNRFYCGGRFMTAPNAGVFLLTVFLISGTSTLFFIFDCKYLAENVTIAIPIIGVILFLFTMSSLLRTSLSDPGIIPRATAEEAAYVEKQIEVTNSANSPTYRPPPRTKEVVVKGQTIKLKYCFTCKLFRPPRASHCSICDNCVERFDHHCPWVGNCVGRRNYRFFYMFIISLAFLAVFIFACALAHLILITKEGKFFEAVKDSPASAIIAIICFFSVWSVLGLAGFHTYLTTSNQTTNEDIKGSFTSKRGQDSFNPYSQGNVCLNCFYILCGPVSPSLIDRRGIVTESYRSEINQIINMDTPIQTLLNHTIKQNGSTNLTHHHQSTELPGIYRQTTETTNNAGTLKRHILISSPKNCSNPKIIPSPPPYSLYAQPVIKKMKNDVKNSTSMPQLKKLSSYYNNLEKDTKLLMDYSHQYLRAPPPVVPEEEVSYNSEFTRPFTPKEKRYNSNTFGHQRPKSCVYENFYVAAAAADDDQFSKRNVKIPGYPKAEFSRMYVQKSGMMD